MAQLRAAVREPAFRIALTNNLLIIVVSLAFQLPLALGMAILLADRVRGTASFRLIFFLPYILAEIAAGLIWRFVYDGEYGLLAKLWELFGGDAALTSSPNPTLPSTPSWSSWSGSISAST